MNELNRNTLAANSVRSVLERLKQQADTHVWRVYREYESVPSADTGTHIRAVTEDTAEDFVGAHELSDVGLDVCIDFAEAAKDPRTMETDLMEWVSANGLLGLAYEPFELPKDFKRENVESYGLPEEHTPEILVPPTSYKDYGGPGETIAALKEEALVVKEILVLYQAALDKDTKTLEAVLLSESANPYDMDKKHRENRVRGYQHHHKVPRRTALAGVALERLAALINVRLNCFVCPVITKPEQGAGSATKIGGFSQTLRPRNLLGAMHLQLYYLVTSKQRLDTCRYCGRQMSPKKSSLNKDGEPRKTRSDRRFCNQSCRQNAAYHKKRKRE